MPMRIIGTLFVLILVFGIGGCSGDKPSMKTSIHSLPLTISSQGSPNQADLPATTRPTSQTQTASINPSNGTLSESPDNTLKKSNVQKNLVPVLYYHSVMSKAGNELSMPPDQFETQMAYLQDKGYQSVSLNQLCQARYLGRSLPTKPFVITFDDGYVDNYTTAFPILKKYGFSATIFMVSSYINGEGFMSWPQLKELTANGWEIEGHTVNHQYLTKLDATTVLNELKSSKELLEKGLGNPVDFFAYPYGDLNADVALAVKNTGYIMAFTTERGWADLKADAWHLHRVYCYAFMGLNEFSRRIQNPNY
jgi:peptidoglycan/xylan/chitin deacetylase (PgdA/CDA1 family)